MPMQAMACSISTTPCATSSQAEGSDLHLKVPSPPLMRVHGALQPDRRRRRR